MREYRKSLLGEGGGEKNFLLHGKKHMEKERLEQIVAEERILSFYSKLHNDDQDENIPEKNIFGLIYRYRTSSRVIAVCDRDGEYADEYATAFGRTASSGRKIGDHTMLAVHH